MRLPLVVVLVLVAVPPARAADVSLIVTDRVTVVCGATGADGADPLEAQCYYHEAVIRDMHATVVDAAGVDDDLVLSTDASTLTVSARAQPLTAREGCTQVDPGTVRCTPPPPDPPHGDPVYYGDVTLTANLGPGDDVLSSPRAIDDPYGDTVDDVQVDGGDGEDRISMVSGRVNGGPDNDTLLAPFAYGEEGDDDLYHESKGLGSWLSGGPGDDVLRGGSGGEYFSPGPGRDLVAGGPGRDELDNYELGPQPALIDLDGDPPAAAPGVDVDIIRSVEDVSAGPGDDVVLGTAGDNEVSAGAGDDQVVGGDGDDQIYGGAGSDVLRGGLGADLLYGAGDAGSSGADRLVGGPGDDQFEPGPNDVSLGQGGSDIFFDPGDGAYRGGPGRDTVTAEERLSTLRRGTERIEGRSFLPPPRLVRGGLRIWVIGYRGRLRTTIDINRLGRRRNTLDVRSLGQLRTRTRRRAAQLLLPLTPQRIRHLRGRIIVISYRISDPDDPSDKFGGWYRVRLR